MFGFGGGAFFGGGGPGPGRFEATYRAYPVSFADRSDAEAGDKLLLPPSALDRLAALHVEYPMLFRLEAPESGRATHCGVLEFVADEGVAYLPAWMMQNLALAEGDTVRLASASLPKATFVKLRPHTSDFLDISDPRAVLERALRGFSCLTAGDAICLPYNAKRFYIDVVEATPGGAVSVIETDCEVDFAPPLDYKEPAKVFKNGDGGGAGGSGGSGGGDGAVAMATDGGGAVAAAGAAAPVAEAAAPAEPAFVPFVGAGRRLDGKPAAPATAAPPPVAPAAAAPAPPPPPPATTFGGGNRLQAKQQAAAAAAAAEARARGVAPPPAVAAALPDAPSPAAASLAAAAAPAAAGGAPPDEPDFKPFQGKGRSLRD